MGLHCSGLLVDGFWRSALILLRLELFDANVAIHELGPFGLEADAAFFEGDGVSVFVLLGEVGDFVDDFAIEDEGGFFRAVDADFHLVPFTFGFFLTELSGVAAAGSLFAFGVEVFVFSFGVDAEVSAEDEEITGVEASGGAAGVGLIAGGFADLHFKAEGPDFFEVAVDVEEEAGVAVPIGAGGEALLEPLVFEL